MAANSMAKFPSFGRRPFLFSFAAFGLTPTGKKSDKNRELLFRFLTPECEIRMSVQNFDNSALNNLQFRDALTNRISCVSAEGDSDPGCLQRFNGSVAIAHYHFRSRAAGAKTPLRLRELVHTIDQDSRMSPRRPFERALAVEMETASDIQAFGYDPGDKQQAASAKSASLWAMLRQDLFLNDQSSAFLTVHWKHTFDLISLVDVIPGETTEQISE
jgi:hypothetical protein